MALSRFLLVGMMWASPALAQQQQLVRTPASEPALHVKTFSMPIVEYQAPDGTWKRGQGIIVGRDISPRTTVGLGLFRMKPKYDDGPTTPFAGKSKKVAVGLTMRF